MIGAHASYVQGAVSEAIGNVTGSADWQKSGQSVKESAVEDMRAASAVDKSQPPAENPTFGGKVEAALGNAVGCEGMGAFACLCRRLRLVCSRPGSMRGAEHCSGPGQCCAPGSVLYTAS